MPTWTVVKYSLPLQMRQDMPFGAYVGGCDMGCPHYERCAWLVRQWIPAEHITIGCEVLVKDLDAWAAGVDADPEYRAWVAELRTARDGAGEAT
jgi:hypothetical protein